MREPVPSMLLFSNIETGGLISVDALLEPQPYPLALEPKALPQHVGSGLPRWLSPCGCGTY